MLNQERQLPHSLDNEMAVVGCMLQEAKIIPEVRAVLGKGEAILMADLRTIYEQALLHYDAGKSMDLALMLPRLGPYVMQSELTESWSLLMIDCAQSVGAWARGPEYAELVMEQHRRRRAIVLCDRLSGTCYEASGLDCREFISEAAIELEGLVSMGKLDMGSTPVELTPLTKQRIRHKGTILETGLHAIDAHVHGLRRGDVTIIAARPSLGKTALALTIARNIANKDIGCLFFSIEMTSYPMHQRYISLDSGEPVDRLLSGQLDPALHCAMVEHANKAPAGKRLRWIYDIHHVERLCDMARIITHKEGIQAIFVDYLQLLSAKGRFGGNRNLELSHVSRKLKLLASETNTAMVLVSQLSREVEKADRPPRLSDLRDCGSLEQDADAVWFLSRDKQAGGSSVKWSVGKNRNGPVGMIEYLNFRPETTDYA